MMRQAQNKFQIYSACMIRVDFFPLRVRRLINGEKEIL